MGAPCGAWMSTPRCQPQRPRLPKPDVTWPCTGQMNLVRSSRALTSAPGRDVLLTGPPLDAPFSSAPRELRAEGRDRTRLADLQPGTARRSPTRSPRSEERRVGQE